MINLMSKPILTTEMLKKYRYSKSIIQIFQQYYTNGITEWNLEEQIKLLKTPLRRYLGSFWRDCLLENISMRGVDFRGVNFTGADLKGSYLSGADLTEADLTGTDLTNVFIHETTFHKTILTNTKLDPKIFYKYFLKK